MLIRFDEIPDGFEKIIFDTNTDNWEDIEISLANNGSHCFINKKDRKTTIIEAFKLSNNPKVNTYCSWSFYKSSKTGKFIPRPTFYKLKNNNELQETKNEKVNISLKEGELAGKFWDVVSFIQGFNELIDIGEFQKNYKVISKNDFIVEFNSYSSKEQIEMLLAFVGENELSYKDLEQLLYNSKKNSLKTFELLLNNVSTTEKQWQTFFEQNMWIFAGISLNLFFIQETIPQANVGLTNTQGHGSPHVDLLGINDYTTIVELKRSDTLIFTDNKSNKSRTNTWSFSNDFIEGISQCLAQKQALVSTPEKDFVTKDERIINAESQDPRTIFIIGNKKKEFPNIYENANDKLKYQTFERYRRNSRNVEIITYDELFERAKFIVDNNI